MQYISLNITLQNYSLVTRISVIPPIPVCKLCKTFDAILYRDMK